MTNRCCGIVADAVGSSVVQVPVARVDMIWCFQGERNQSDLNLFMFVVLSFYPKKHWSYSTKNGPRTILFLTYNCIKDYKARFRRKVKKYICSAPKTLRFILEIYYYSMWQPFLLWNAWCLTCGGVILLPRTLAATAALLPLRTVLLSEHI